jgi:hypothetical protein
MLLNMFSHNRVAPLASHRLYIFVFPSSLSGGDVALHVVTSLVGASIADVVTGEEVMAMAFSSAKPCPEASESVDESELVQGFMRLVRSFVVRGVCTGDMVRGAFPNFGGTRRVVDVLWRKAIKRVGGGSTYPRRTKHARCRTSWATHTYTRLLPYSRSRTNNHVQRSISR